MAEVPGTVVDRPRDPGLRGHRSAPPTRTTPRRAVWQRGRGTALLFLAPAALFYGLFVLLPWLHSAWISLYAWDGIGVATWVGFANYVTVFTEPALVGAFVHAIGFIGFYTVIPVFLGTVLAAILAASRRRGAGLLRTVLFLPQVLPLVAVGVIWRYLYSQDGLVNHLLTAVGLESLTRPWLGDFDTAYGAVGLVGTWVATGLCTILMLAGIQKIDPALYEAARLDGANRRQEFRHITVPGLRREVVVATTVTMVSALASFDVVYATTGGGPGTSTMVPGMMIYQLVFTANRVGVACALATVLSAFTVLLVALINRLGRER